MLPRGRFLRPKIASPKNRLHFRKVEALAQLFQKESPPYLFFSNTYPLLKANFLQKNTEIFSFFFDNFFSTRSIDLKFSQDLALLFPHPEQFSF